MIVDIWLDSENFVLKPLAGTDDLVRADETAETFNVLIGENGSGKTRALKQISAAMAQSGEAFDCHINFFGDDSSRQAELDKMGVIYFTPIPFPVGFDLNDERFIDASLKYGDSLDTNIISFENLKYLKSKLRILENPQVTMSFNENKLLAMIARTFVRAIVNNNASPAILKKIDVKYIQGQNSLILRSLAKIGGERGDRSAEKVKIPREAVIVAQEICSQLKELINDECGENYIPIMSSLNFASEQLRMDAYALSIIFLKIILKLDLGHASRLAKVEERYVSQIKKVNSDYIEIYSAQNKWEIVKSDDGLVTAKVDYKNSGILSKFPDAKLIGYVSIQWSQFSSGQLALLHQFSLITKNAKKMHESGLRELLLLVDEGDIYLHTSWQRMYVELLTTLVKDIKKVVGMTTVQVILTTHSPAVITDVPSKNILLLSRKKSKKKATQIKSFAASPQDIINSSFNSDSIGSYAQNILKKIAHRIKTKGASENDEVIISQIDDPILRREFQRLVAITKNK